MSEVQTPETPTPETDETPSQNGATPSQVETVKVKSRTVAELFKYATFVHVGPGAGECEGKENGKCSDPTHFHAWLRLPNKFQINAIREKAQAGKARTIRQLRDPESDKFAILEGDIDLLRDIDDKAQIVEDVLSKQHWKDHMEAAREVAEEGEEFEHIDDDQERWQALDSMDEEERDEDEYQELGRHIQKFHDTVEKKREEKQGPQRQALTDKPMDELLEMVRDDRISAEGNSEFMRTYSLYLWFSCTLKPRDPQKGLPVERVWGSVENMKAAAPEVIETIESTFEALEGAFASRNQEATRAEGNS